MPWGHAIEWTGRARVRGDPLGAQTAQWVFENSGRRRSAAEIQAWLGEYISDDEVSEIWARHVNEALLAYGGTGSRCLDRSRRAASGRRSSTSFRPDTRPSSRRSARSRGRAALVST